MKERQTAAFEQFRSLPPVEPIEIVGLWQGRGIPAGHPLDGVLENLGWFGKRFRADMRADASLFGTRERGLIAIDPAGYRFAWHFVSTRSGARAPRGSCSPICSAVFRRVVRWLS